MSIIAMTRSTFEPDVRNKVLSFSREAVKLFPKHKGFMGIRTLLSQEGNEIVSVIEWETEEGHTACQQSLDWNSLLPQWTKLLESGKMTFEVKLFVSLE
ncbi:MAG: antibiotic biosynthesis monooxygenase family protein [Acidiferrobacterales bacterium]